MTIESSDYVWEMIGLRSMVNNHISFIGLNIFAKTGEGPWMKFNIASNFRSP